MRSRVAYSLRNFWRTMSVGGWLAFLLIIFDDKVAQAVSGELPPPRLLVYELRYEDGLIYQHVSPEHRPILFGQWTAAINTADGTRSLCSGGGAAPYRQRTAPVAFTPSEWTEDDCRLIPGETYTATAAWEWTTDDGEIDRTAASFDFVASETPPPS